MVSLPSTATACALKRIKSHANAARRAIGGMVDWAVKDRYTFLTQKRQ